MSHRTRFGDPPCSDFLSCPREVASQEIGFDDPIRYPLSDKPPWSSPSPEMPKAAPHEPRLKVASSTAETACRDGHPQTRIHHFNLYPFVLPRIRQLPALRGPSPYRFLIANSSSRTISRPEVLNMRQNTIRHNPIKACSDLWVIESLACPEPPSKTSRHSKSYVGQITRYARAH